MGRWRALVVLGTAQFLMVLDTAVMNVSISKLVEDFHTEVTAIQAVITLYALVMAAFMITGGQLSDRLGRRRMFGIGLVVYGTGSALTAAAPVLWVLALGWSVIEGLGAALVLPSLAALVAGSYHGRERAVAYGVIGGLAGAAIAVGPLLGGWVTTYLTWRLVFVGEVVVVLAILAVLRWIPADPARRAHPSRLDVVGVVLSAAGLALVVLGTLQSGTWGWLQPRNPPFTVFGFAPTVFVIGAGAAALFAFARWERHLEGRERKPLIRLGLLGIPTLRSGLLMLLNQNTILLGLFFVIPLYLQVVQGFDAFQTGLRLLPVSVTMLVAAMGGPALGRFASPRTIVRVGLLLLLASTIWLLATIRPVVDDLSFAFAMALLGLGMGLLASQLGNVVQSSVGDADRSEVGGLQYTAQNLGSALGTALIGAIVVGTLAASFSSLIAKDPQISAQVRQQSTVRLEAGVTFAPVDQVAAALAKTAVPPNEQQALLQQYKTAQLNGLKAAILAATGITLVGFAVATRLPTTRTTGSSTDTEPTTVTGAGGGSSTERATKDEAA